MKKLYVLLFLLPLFSLQAQVPTCGYDHTFIASGRKGVWPDSATNFVGGTVGTPYSQNITIVVPYDTVSGGTTLHFSHIDFTNPTTAGLPPGLAFTGTPSNYHFPGNDSSCMVIYGTPTTAGTYTLNIKLTAYVTELGSIPASNQTLKYYKIVIAPATGIATNGSYNFQVMQNMPNPVADNTIIKFTSPAEGKAKFTVFNIAGQKVTEKDITAQRGDNKFDFDATQLENGIYLYTVEMNQQKQCRRMVIAR